MTPEVVDDVPEAELLQSVIDTLPSSLAVVDTTGRILLTNQAWREFGEANDIEMIPSMTGMNYFDVTDGADDTYSVRAAAGLRAVLEGETDLFTLEYPCHSPSERRWFLMRAVPFIYDGERYGAVTHIDITARRERETVLQDTYEVITATDRSVEEKIEALLETLREALGTDYGTLSRIEGEEYVFEAVAPSTETDPLTRETVPIEALPLCERVIESERTIVHSNVEREAPALQDSKLGITSYLGAPVVADGEVYGTFCFYSMDSREEGFSDWEVTLVELLSKWVSYEIDQRAYKEKLQQLKENTTDVIWMSTPQKDEIEFVTDAYERVWGRPPATLQNSPTSFVDAIHPDDRDRVRRALEEQQEDPDEYDETYRVVQPDGEVRWVHDQSVGVYDEQGVCQRIIGIASDITEHKKYEQQLERQRDDLLQLKRLNTLVRQIGQALQETPTRDAIETEVCERLTETDLYQAVWIGVRGESDTGSQTVIPQTAVGVETSYLDGIPGGESGPAERTLETGEVQVINDIATTPQFPEERRETALAQHHHALATVPLSAGGTTYGVLVVYAPPGHTITDAERDVLSDLGQNIALAIQRVYSQRSLSAEMVLALDLRIPDSAFVFGTVTTELDCKLELERRVSATDGTTIYYLRVRNADPEEVCAFLERSPVITASDIVRHPEDDQSPLIEVQLEEAAHLPLDVLTAYGGSIKTAQAVDGDIELSVELPPEVSVRSVLHDLQEIAPGIVMQSKRQIERPITTIPAIQQQVRDRLTLKQVAALEASYARGYYEWPRDSTAEDIAETLDITSPSLHYRLRKAHRAVIATLLDDTEIHRNQ